MQNHHSAFPHLAFSQNQSEKISESQLPPELQLLLSASLDQNLYANQLAALKNATASMNPTTSTAVNGIPSDFASLILSSLAQQQTQSQTSTTSEIQQQHSQLPTTPSTTTSSSATTVAASIAQQQQQQQDDFAQQLMALIAGPQQPSVSSAAAAATNNFLEQMNFFTSPSFNIATSQQHQNSSMIPTTPTSSGSGSHFFGGMNASMSSPNKDKDSYCEFCDKNFCNRYFLRIHKQKKHGIRMESGSGDNVPDTPPAKQQKLEQSVSPIKHTGSFNAASSEEEQQQQQLQPKQKESMDGMQNNIEAMLAAFQEAQNNNNKAASAASQPDLLSLIQQLAKVKSPEPQATEKYNCDKCSQDFTSQTLLLQHQLTQHTVIPSSSSPPTSSTASQQNILNMMPAGFPSLPFMMPQLQSNFPTLEMENAFGSHPSLAQSLSSKPSAPKRQYSSTTKNYCDLCNKEVCNKYFLRTHMLKMHNIVIDENKTVIANIDTQEKEKEGSVSFRCDVCQTDMKTRTQLKDHKKSVHGIQPVVAPTSASSSKPPSAIGSGASQGETTAFEFPPTSTTSPRSSSPSEFKCIRCENEFDSFQTLVIHLQAEHVNEISEQEIFEYLTKASTSAATFSTTFQEQSHHDDSETVTDGKISGAEDESDEAMEITREVAMKMAVENQMKIDDEEMESEATTFLCNTCGRNYSNQQNLNDHVATVHQYKVRLSPKKEVKTILSPNKVNKIVKCFTCAKCNQRFASSHLCKLHIIQHLRREQKDDGETTNDKNENIIGESSSSANADELKEHKCEDFEDDLITSFMREDSSIRDKSGSIIENVVSELSRRGSHGAIPRLPNDKQLPEHNSHTSGSASPMSITLPEGFAEPLQIPSRSPKPFVLQSFIMKSDSNAFPNELHCYLPVKSFLEGSFRVTFELEAAPQLDSQIKHL
uniref:C2H2-type domain-containing protein n=1 Tax=Panagrolaimus superbus TaxID=310955 RepID=A0A914Y0S5_9BILA